MKQMFRALTLLLLSFAIATAASEKISTNSKPAEAKDALRYTIEPVLNEDSLRFQVEVEFKGDANGVTYFIMPDSWLNAERLYEGIKSLQATSPDTQIVGTDKPHIKHFAYKPNQIVRFKYEVTQKRTGPFTGEPSQINSPILQKSFFHFFGGGFFVYPQWSYEEKSPVRLEWKNVPSDWKICNSFGVDQLKQTFIVSYEELEQSVFVGGDYRIKKIQVEEKPLYIAIRGTWKTSDEVFCDLLQRIIKAERDFWNDHDFPSYLIVLTPNGQSNGFFRGNSLTDSFTAFMDAETEVNIHLKYLLAHEIFHTWNNRKLGSLKSPTELWRWFTEGFTDYYARLILLRSGLISLEEYVADYNRRIAAYYFSPARNAKSARIIQDTYKDPFIDKLPYQRGDMLAHRWNALIRANTKGKSSLDDVMRDLFKRAKEEQQLITNEVFNEIVKRYAGRDILDEIKRYTENGETVEGEPDAFGACVKMNLVEMGQFDLGFDLNALQSAKTIAQVKEGSAAYQAGLRNGQIVVGHSIWLEEPLKEVVLYIKDKQGSKEIKYLPMNMNRIKTPQYQINKDSTNDCRF
jgi:predicted metalloprotease with PDZ domain